MLHHHSAPRYRPTAVMAMQSTTTTTTAAAAAAASSPMSILRMGIRVLIGPFLVKEATSAWRTSATFPTFYRFLMILLIHPHTPPHSIHPYGKGGR
jgi:hypothetical protein